ncbi:MAG: hypothetical protein Q4A90_05175 [Streptococcus sp.]|nr:hypothetical protein [Streptococcus sp.]
MLEYLRDNWLQVLSSIGLGTLISTFLTLAQSNKKNNLEYITKERSAWRKNLHEIISEMRTVEDVENNISKIETYLNPYGYEIKNKHSRDYYLKDGHIWYLLRNFKSQDDLVKLKYYLNLLLKYDWERSKKEVRINFLDILFAILRLIATGILVYLVLFLNPQFMDFTAYFKTVVDFIALASIWFIDAIDEFIIKKEIRTKNNESILLTFFGGAPYIWIIHELDTHIQFLKQFGMTAFGIIICSLTLLMILLVIKLENPSEEYIIHIKSANDINSKYKEESFKSYAYRDELALKLNKILEESMYIKGNQKISRRNKKLEKKIKDRKYKNIKQSIKIKYAHKKRIHKYQLLNKIIKHNKENTHERTFTKIQSS